MFSKSPAPNLSRNAVKPTRAQAVHLSGSPQYKAVVLQALKVRMCVNVRETSAERLRGTSAFNCEEAKAILGPSWSRRLKTSRPHRFIEWSLCLFSKMGKVRIQRWWIVVELSELSNVQNTSDIPMN